MPRNWEYRDCTACGCTFRFAARCARSPAKSGPLFPLEVFVADLLGPSGTPPCPECGCVPRATAAKRKRLWHAGLGASLLVGFVLVGLLGLLPGVARISYSWAGVLLGCGAVVGLVSHAAVAFSDPNRNPARNLQRANALVDRGWLETVSDPDAELVDATPPQTNRGAAQFLAVGAAATLLTLAPLALTVVKGWPVSADTVPEVVSPGDTVRVWFPEKVNAVNGHWSGSPQAVLTGPDGPTALPARAQNDTWGEKISGKSVNNQVTWPWADVKLPDDPRLAGTTLEVRVDMSMEYPTAFGSRFKNVDVEMTVTRHYQLAEPGASTAYLTSFVVALAGVGLVSACGFGLWGLEGGLRRVGPE